MTYSDVSLMIERITEYWFFTRWLTSRIRSRIRFSFSLWLVMSRGDRKSVV